MAVKKVVFKKKIDNAVYDIYAKTSADQVEYNSTTVAEQLAQFTTDLSTITTATTGTIDTRIKTATDALYNKIMGFTDSDTTINEAYDTLKEVAKYLTDHGDVVSGFTTDITALKNTIGTASNGTSTPATGLIARIEALETATAKITKIETDLGELSDEVNGLSSTVSGLSGAIDDIPVVEKSNTNGNIKIDSVETTVYTHPESHAASMIVEDDQHKFVTAAEKSKIGDSAKIVYATAAPDASGMADGDLYLVEVTA